MNRVPAKVVASLTRGTIDLILLPGPGGGAPMRIEAELIPAEFRHPNCEFIALLDGCWIVGGEGMPASDNPE